MYRYETLLEVLKRVEIRPPPPLTLTLNPRLAISESIIASAFLLTKTFGFRPSELVSRTLDRVGPLFHALLSYLSIGTGSLIISLAVIPMIGYDDM